LRDLVRRGATPPHCNDIEQVGGSNPRPWVEIVPVDDAGDSEDGRLVVTAISWRRRANATARRDTHAIVLDVNRQPHDVENRHGIA